MIELIIVVALMGIIGAVLVPTFSDLTTKARITSDVTTVKTLQKQFEIYKAETGAYPKAADVTGGADFPASGTAKTVPDGSIKVLVGKGYLDANDLTSSGGLKLQTDGKLQANGGRCYLSFDSDSKYADYVNKINTGDKKNGNAGYVKVE